MEDRLPTLLRRCRLVVQAGEKVKEVPIAIAAATDRLAMGKALRIGRRFFGRDFIAAATADGFRLNSQRTA